jgi:hypothetical protein
MYCCCVSILIVICICPPGALIWLINLFLFLFLFHTITSHQARRALYTVGCVLLLTAVILLLTVVIQVEFIYIFYIGGSIHIPIPPCLLL